MVAVSALLVYPKGERFGWRTEGQKWTKLVYEEDGELMAIPMKYLECFWNGKVSDEPG